MRTHVVSQVRASGERARRERLAGPQIIQQAAGGGGGAAIRLAKAQHDAGEDQTIACRMVDKTLNATGDLFDVHGLVMGTDPDAPLSECSPLVFAGDLLWIARNGDDWYFITAFDAHVPCECQEAGE